MDTQEDKNYYGEQFYALLEALRVSFEETGDTSGFYDCIEALQEEVNKLEAQNG